VNSPRDCPFLNQTGERLNKNNWFKKEEKMSETLSVASVDDEIESSDDTLRYEIASNLMKIEPPKKRVGVDDLGKPIYADLVGAERAAYFETLKTGAQANRAVAMAHKTLNGVQDVNETRTGVVGGTEYTDYNPYLEVESPDGKKSVDFTALGRLAFVDNYFGRVEK
jgi:hypothetical protein